MPQILRGRQSLGDFAPKLVDLTDNVLFGDVWERPQLSKRDRSLITCAALIATGKTEQMDFHLPNAIKNQPGGLDPPDRLDGPACGELGHFFDFACASR